MFRTLRAYPGAPPRIPHGLTPEEFRGTECKACHERGGWVGRFSAYAPVTPHPELEACLQCHVPDDRVVGIAPSFGSFESTCRQCHRPGQAVPVFVATSWRPAPWPAMNRRAMPGSPPAIPHGLELRGNCLACHMGAAAVEEIRTDHPERASCRQCHVPVAEDAVFARPRDDSARSPGGQE
jgi:cytochrome c-type protein NapB